jgi:hypothetical protein
MAPKKDLRPAITSPRKNYGGNPNAFQSYPMEEGFSFLSDLSNNWTPRSGLGQGKMNKHKNYSLKQEPTFNKDIYLFSGADQSLKFDQKYEIAQEPLSFYSNLLPKHSSKVLVEHTQLPASFRSIDLDEEAIKFIPEDDQQLPSIMPRMNNTQTKAAVDLRQILHTKVKGLVQDSGHQHHSFGGSSTPKENFSFKQQVTGSACTDCEGYGSPIIEKTSSKCLQGYRKPDEDPNNLKSLLEPENFTEEEETILSGYRHRYVLETKLLRRSFVL